MNPSSDAAHRFHKSGNLNFLSSIRREGEQRGYELPAGSAERELLARKAAMTKVAQLAEAR